MTVFIAHFHVYSVCSLSLPPHQSVLSSPPRFPSFRALPPPPPLRSAVIKTLVFLIDSPQGPLICPHTHTPGNQCSALGITLMCVCQLAAWALKLKSFPVSRFSYSYFTVFFINMSRSHRQQNQTFIWVFSLKFFSYSSFPLSSVCVCFVKLCHL